MGRRLELESLPTRHCTTMRETAVGGGIGAIRLSTEGRAHDDGVSVCGTRRWYCGVSGWVSLNEKKLINNVEC
jgi:hypothetical protein